MWVWHDNLDRSLTHRVRVVADCGVDGVKVDVQGTVGLMGSKLGGGPDMTRKYHQSLERSVQAAFPGNHCINCMCHSTENLYRCDLLSVYEHGHFVQRKQAKIELVSAQ